MINLKTILIPEPKIQILKGLYLWQAWIFPFEFAYCHGQQMFCTGFFASNENHREKNSKNFHLLSRSRHVFTNFPNANPQIFSPIFLSWKNKQILYWAKKTFFLSFEHVRKSKQILHNIWWKKFVDLSSENSWKHVVSSI